jgi:hypothetical protein
MQILSTIAEAVTEYPDGIVREVIFPLVKEEIFRNLVAEFRVTGQIFACSARLRCSGSLLATTAARCLPFWRLCNSTATIGFSL